MHDGKMRYIFGQVSPKLASNVRHLLLDRIQTPSWQAAAVCSGGELILSTTSDLHVLRVWAHFACRDVRNPDRLCWASIDDGEALARLWPWR